MARVGDDQSGPVAWLVGAAKAGAFAVVAAVAIWLMTQLGAKADAREFRAVEKQQATDAETVRGLGRRLDRIEKAIDGIAAKLGVAPTP